MKGISVRMLFCTILVAFLSTSRSSLAVGDTLAPKIIHSAPSGTLSAGLTNVRLMVATDEPAECRLASEQNTAFEKMTETLNSLTGSTTHERVETGLDEYLTHVYTVRCMDLQGNVNNEDYILVFSFGSTLTGDFTLPSVPDLSLADANYSQITLAWSQGYDNTAIANYRVYKCAGDNCVPHAIAHTATTTRHADVAVARELSYGYQVTSVDTSGNESPRSNILRASSTPLAVQLSNNIVGELETDIVIEPSLPSSQVSSTTAYVFERALRVGDKGSDVLKLQQFLNTQGFAVAVSGPGSIGMETDFFGGLTGQAVVRFQEAHRADVLTPVGLTTGSGYFGPSTLAKANKILASVNAQDKTEASTGRPSRRVLTPADRLRILTAQVRALQSAIERYAKEIE